MKISFIIVNYNSDAYLKQCISSLRAFLLDISYEIIIVQNDQAEKFSLDLTEEKNIRLVCTYQNLGFAKANNFGAIFGKGTYFCFLNPDTLFLQQDLNPLLKKLALTKTGIVSPSLVTDYALTLQPWSAGNDLTLLETFRNKLPSFLCSKIWLKTTTQQVGWVSGACFFIKKTLFEELAGFDENFFMYFEDVDLCRRAREKKFEVLLVPEYKVLHWGGKSKQSDVLQKKYYYQSQDYYFQKHFGTFQRLLIQTLRKLFQKKA